MDPLAPPPPPPPPAHPSSLHHHQLQLQPQLHHPPAPLMDPPLPTLPEVQATTVPVNFTFTGPPLPPSAVAVTGGHHHSLTTTTTNNSTHPPYAQMITQAISALKEKNGSSKSAITKYIEQNYSDLPSTHSALLTQHLKRLKDSGQLVMVKHSYKLPGSATSTAVPQFQSNGPKRGPGRPPKPKYTAVNIQQQPPPQQQQQQQVMMNATTTGPISVPESVFQSLGLVDDGPVKKRPGRPRKVGTVVISGGATDAAAAAPPAATGFHQNPVAVSGRRPGRPSKNKAINALLAVSPSGKRRGRPPKNFGVVSRKPRGRPPKNAVAHPSTVVGATGPILVQSGYVADAAIAPALAPLTTAAVSIFKKRGRPPLSASGPKKPRKLTGKPLGRPRKRGPLTPGQVSNMQLMTYQELRNKLEYIQTRIKQAVGVLKPVLEAQSAANALAAVQELEELAAVDVNAPPNLQNRLPPPALEN